MKSSDIIYLFNLKILLNIGQNDGLCFDISQMNASTAYFF